MMAPSVVELLYFCTGRPGTLVTNMVSAGGFGFIRMTVTDACEALPEIRQWNVLLFQSSPLIVIS